MAFHKFTLRVLLYLQPLRQDLAQSGNLLLEMVFRNEVASMRIKHAVDDLSKVQGRALSALEL